MEIITGWQGLILLMLFGSFYLWISYLFSRALGKKYTNKIMLINGYIGLIVMTMGATTWMV